MDEGKEQSTTPLIRTCYCCEKCQKRDLREGGENSHKVQCKMLVEIRTMYAENAKREIEEKMARWGVLSREDGGPSNMSRD